MSGDTDDTLLLRDFSISGKSVPWAALRRSRLELATAYERIGQAFRPLAARMRECGRRLEFERYFVPDRQHDLLHLSRASFCRARLCPGCQVRLARKQHFYLCELAGGHLKRRPGDQVLLLTLTTRNVVAAELGGTIDLLLRSFRKLVRRKRVATAVAAWYRTLEVTRNDDTGEFHAHLHVLLFVPPAYFQRASGLYIDQAAHEWTALWRKSLGVDYDPIVDVRRAYGVSDDDQSGLAELTKYVTKPGALVALDSEQLHDVHLALKGRRLVGMSASLRALADDLGLADPEDDDTDAAFKLPDGAIYLGREIYEWHGGRNDYLLRWRISATGGPHDVAQNE
jgi:plasmid rolling circle replication initiator protein Rep